MKKHNPYLKSILCLALATFGLALSGSHASAQTTIAKWTFENLSINPGSSLTNFSNGRSITNILPEIGSGNASGSHPGTPAFGSGTWGTVTGNGSSKALTSAGWTNNPAATSGDYYQFAVSTVGFTNIGVTFDSVGSATGPKNFIVQYSTDGVTFTTFGSPYAVLSSPSWAAGAPVTGETYTNDFSAITALANKSVVYIRLVVSGNTAINNSPIGTSGTSRVDNFAVTGTIAGPPQIVTQPQGTTNFFGDTVTLNVTAGGDAPLSVQWYFPDLNTPLTDGSSGFGAGTISGSTNQTLTLSFISTNQAGNYQVVITNSLGAKTSIVAQVTVNVRPTIVTNIAYLHTLHDANFVLNDGTNIYQVEGIVTTPGNLVTPPPASSFYVQDASGGVNVFFRGGFGFSTGTVPASGDHVRITAPLQQFNGSLEMSPTNGNPSQNIEDLDSGNSLPAPQNFDFTMLPTPTVMEESIEGRYMVVTNVFLGITNADPHLVGNETIFMTNLTGQVFRMNVANNPVLQPIGNGLPGSFATSVVGVMQQSQSSGTALTNGYSLILADLSQITVGSPPVNPIPLAIQLSGGNNTLTWSDASFSLQTSTNVAGPYTTVDGATSPYTILTTNTAAFYRLMHP